MAIQWGYGINSDRQIDLDSNDRSLFEAIRKREPSIVYCISCGTCASGCTTASFTPFSLRSIILSIHRGETAEVLQELSKCMLCGKCQLACPRGVNTRNLILSILSELSEDDHQL